MTKERAESYISSREQYYHNLELLRVELEQLEREQLERQLNGFKHFGDVAKPVELESDGSYRPLRSPDTRGRLHLSTESAWVFYALVDIYNQDEADDNVWLGPPQDCHSIDGLNPAEHRGIWVRSI